MSRIKGTFDQLESEWDYLSSSKKADESFTVKKYPFSSKDHDMRIGIDDKRLHALIRMDIESDQRDSLKIYEGLEYSIHELNIDDNAAIWFDMYAELDRQIQFSLFLAYFLNFLEAHDPLDALETSRRILRRYWSGSFNILSKAKQIGLFGELFVLEKLISSKGREYGLECWQGPNEGLHDFIGSSLDIEVKSTLRDPPNVRISSLEQLVPTETKSLSLVVNMIGQGDGRTLSEYIDQIYEGYFNDNPDSAIKFEKKLLDVGYSHEFSKEYSIQFKIKKQIYVDVDLDTPVLNSDFISLIPSTVHNISYTLDVNGLSGSNMSDQQWEEVIDRL